jgi:hypothetical protein
VITRPVGQSTFEFKTDPLPTIGSRSKPETVWSRAAGLPSRRRYCSGTLACNLSQGRAANFLGWIFEYFGGPARKCQSCPLDYVLESSAEDDRRSIKLVIRIV